MRNYDDLLRRGVEATAYDHAPNGSFARDIVRELVGALDSAIAERDHAYGEFCQIRDELGALKAIQVDEIGPGQRDFDWVDNEGLTWRWRIGIGAGADGWYWRKSELSPRWIGPSNRGDVIRYRGPFTMMKRGDQDGDEPALANR